MTAAETLKAGEVVHLAGPPGSCFARVLQALRPEELPDIVGIKMKADLVREILTEQRAQQVALIGWTQDSGRRVCCVVLSDRFFQWFDLKGQRVHIRSLTDSELARVAVKFPELFKVRL